MIYKGNAFIVLHTPSRQVLRSQLYTLGLDKIDVEILAKEIKLKAKALIINVAIQSDQGAEIEFEIKIRMEKKPKKKRKGLNIRDHELL